MRTITTVSIHKFVQDLYVREKASATVQKYRHAIKEFAEFLDGEEFTKENLIRYREHLITLRTAQTVNIALTAINSYAEFRGWQGLRVKYLKTQRTHFLAENRELSR